MANLKYYDSTNGWSSVATEPEQELYISNGVAPTNTNALWVDTSVSGVIPPSYGVADNCTVAQAGNSVLDAHQGKVLMDKVNALFTLDGTTLYITTTE